MLVAYTQEAKHFILHSGIPHSTLKQLRSNTKFYCPQCKQPLRLKVGQLKIPHFAHIVKSDCEGRFSEGESSEHLEGKEQLFKFFQSLNHEVQLEPYLPELQQRPDLLISNNNQQIAIEFQCSSIPFEKLTERNLGYKGVSILPVWIPVTPSKIQSNDIMKVSIPKQLQQFILSVDCQQYIMTYSPKMRQFIYLSNLLFVSGNSFLTKVQALPIKDQKFPFYLPKNLTLNEFSKYLMLYNAFKHNYLQSRVLISRKGVNDLFLRSVYELRLNIQNLPHFLGVPLRGNIEIGTFSLDWQTAFFSFLHVNQLQVQSINDAMIHYFLKWADLAESNKAFQAVKDYCKLLKTLSIQHVHQIVLKEELDNQLYSQFLAINK